MTFAYIAERLLPALISRKNNTGDRAFRICSNSCAMGEEPYFMGIRGFLMKPVSVVNLADTIRTILKHP